MDYQNPHAQNALRVPVLVLCNTSDEKLRENIAKNSARPGKWVCAQPPFDKTAILVGGGPSVAYDIETIREMSKTATIFAMNAAATFLIKHGIVVDYQVIADAKPETVTLVEHGAMNHLFASQVDPMCFTMEPGAVLWHLHMEGMEDVFPPERVKAGGYSIVGGGASVGNSACALAYVLGYRKLHLFGYDSSHRGDASHAYDQPMNRFIPVIDVEWAGKHFRSSVAMKAQAEKFMITGQALKHLGCEITVHGDGLLPTMWNTPIENATEKDKYRLMWQCDAYREHSPGEYLVQTFIELVKPDDLIIDFGCGTGRAAKALYDKGHRVFLIDFADNCRDEEAMDLPFLEWDLTRPIPARAPYGLCTDVMEHIPPDDVEKVVSNIMEASETVMFQISTVKDAFGAVLGTDLHLTVKDHEWWGSLFERLGYVIKQQQKGDVNSLFIITRKGDENGSIRPE
jgi:uncharacterized Rossmann fold enzyme